MPITPGQTRLGSDQSEFRLGPGPDQHLAGFAAHLAHAVQWPPELPRRRFIWHFAHHGFFFLGPRPGSRHAGPDSQALSFSFRFHCVCVV